MARLSLPAASLAFLFSRSRATGRQSLPVEKAFVLRHTHIMLLVKWNFPLFLQVLVLHASQPGQAKLSPWDHQLVPARGGCHAGRGVREQETEAGPQPEMLMSKIICLHELGKSPLEWM